MIVVAGGGVGGLAAALAFARHGLEVTVLERRPGPGNVNRGDSLLPVVTAHLRRWGALDLIMAAGAQPVARMQVHHQGALLFEAPLGGESPYLVLPHAEIERALAAAATRTGCVDVRYNARLASLSMERGRVRGVVAGGRAIPARLVVGADGASSRVRGALGLTLPSRPYRHAFFIVDVDRPAGYADAMRVELHTDGGVLMVPQPGGRVGLGVLVHDPEAFRKLTADEKVAAVARRLGQPLRAHAGAHLYTLKRGHAPRYCAHGAALLGDAAHLTNPTAGQGMTMAVEDAAALAAYAGPALTRNDRDLDAALQQYEAERAPRNRALLGWSHGLSLAYSCAGPLAHGLRLALWRLAGSPLGRRIHSSIWRRLAT